MTESALLVGDDGLERCWWGAGDADYTVYHDDEWGRPETGDAPPFEKLVLEGFQAGLSWITILRKRDRFREVFADFDAAAISRYGTADVDRLVLDAGIIRHRGKIEAAVNNARRAVEVVEEFGSMAAYVWPWAPATDTVRRSLDELPAITEASTALSKDLKRRGWAFVGPTTVYAFMQAMGLVNDHLAGCHARDVCEAARVPLAAHYRLPPGDDIVPGSM